MIKTIATRSLQKNRVIQPPADVQMTNDPETYRRDLVYNWIFSLDKTKLKEIVELENMFVLLKGTTEDRIYGKLVTNKQIDKTDLAHLKLLKELLVDLNRLKYGDKKVNVNVGYKEIQEIMFEKKNVNP